MFKFFVKISKNLIYIKKDNSYMSNKISRLLKFKKNVNKNVILKTEKLLDLEKLERVFISHINDKDTEELKENVFYTDDSYPHNIKSFKILSINDNNFVVNINLTDSRKLDEYFISKAVFLSALIYNVDDFQNSFVNNSHIVDSTINSAYIGVYSKNILTNLKFESLNKLDSDILVVGRDSEIIKTHSSVSSNNGDTLSINSGANLVEIINIQDKFNNSTYTQTFYNSSIRDSIFTHGTFENLEIENTILELYDPDNIESPVIKGGIFRNCVIKNYRIEGGEFYDCVIEGDSSIWINGKWNDSTRGWNLRALKEKMEFVNVNDDGVNDTQATKELIQEILKRDIPNIYYYPYANDYNSSNHLFSSGDGANISKYSFIRYFIENNKAYSGYSSIVNLLQSCLNFPLTIWNDGYCINGNINLDTWNNGTVESKSIRINNWNNGKSKTPCEIVINHWNGGTLDGGNLKYCNIFKNGTINNGQLNGSIESIDNPGVKIEHTFIISCTMNNGNINYSKIKNCTLNNGILSNCIVNDTCTAHGSSIINCDITSLISDNNTYITKTAVKNVNSNNTNFDNTRNLYSGTITESNFIYCDFNSSEHSLLNITTSKLDRCRFNENLIKKIYKSLAANDGTAYPIDNDLSDDIEVLLTDDNIKAMNDYLIYDSSEPDGYRNAESIDSSYRELDLENNIITNSVAVFCNLYSNNLTNSYIYYCDFYDGVIEGGVVKDCYWSYGILKNSYFINSIWVSGSYENMTYLPLPNNKPQKPKRIESYVK